MAQAHSSTASSVSEYATSSSLESSNDSAVELTSAATLARKRKDEMETMQAACCAIKKALATYKSSSDDRKNREGVLKGIVHHHLRTLDAPTTYRTMGLFFKRAWAARYHPSSAFMFLLGIGFSILKKTSAGRMELVINRYVEAAKATVKSNRKAPCPLEESVPETLSELTTFVLFRLLFCSRVLRNQVQDFISGQRKQFAYFTLGKAPALKKTLNEIFDEDLDLLEYMGVDKFLVQQEEYKPHEEGCRVAQIRAPACEGASYVPDTTCAACFNWTSMRNYSPNENGDDQKALAQREDKSNRAIAVLMVFAIECLAPAKTKIDFARDEYSTYSVSDFFKDVSRDQLAWLWSFLIRRAHGRDPALDRMTRCSQMHSNKMFEKCLAWIEHWYPRTASTNGNSAGAVMERNFDLGAAAEMLSSRKRAAPDSPWDEEPHRPAPAPSIPPHVEFMHLFR